VSFKTDRLAALFPDAYSAREGASSLRRLLDAIGHELMGADESVKALLKSHWVNYAQDDALDGLAATFGVQRRRLADGTLEPDDAFRRRLKAVVPYFMGGGTVKAVAGAVRSALGLPFDLELFRREITPAGSDSNDQVAALIQALEGLVRVQEFSPKPESMLSEPVARVADTSEVTVEVAFSSIAQVYPRIEWTFTKGGGRYLTLRRLDSGEGLKSKAALKMNPGETLVLTASPSGALAASVGTTDVSSLFTAWDGTSAPRLPPLPGETTHWKFTSRAGTYDLSGFDDTEGYDSPDFSVRIQWTRYQHLTFDVIVPYFIKRAVEDIQRQTGYQGQLFLFEGLPLEVIQRVVDQTRAAGVKGMVHFSLNFLEDHAAQEQLSGLLQHRYQETHDASEAVSVGSLSTAVEDQNMREAFAIGGVFNVSTFDTSFGFE
jgi:hypothetical protein